MNYTLSGGPYTRSSYYDAYAPKRGGNTAVVPGSAPTIKFRAKAAMRSGVSLAEAVGGVKLSGGDYVKWHEINADARGRIHLRIKVRLNLAANERTDVELTHFILIVERIFGIDIRDPR